MNMIQSEQIGYDLKDILDTLEELKRVVEQQARARVQLEADNAALHRRLLEALAAERRQRCRATSSRTFAKRAQAATQPVIAAQKELVGLKRQLSTQHKNFQEEKKIFEDKICALERDLIRIKEESEAALAAAEFAKEDREFTMGVNQMVTSSAVPSIIETPTAVEKAQPIERSFPPPIRPNRRPLQSINGNTLWTGSGQLVWNQCPVNLTSTIRTPRSLFRPDKPVPTLPRYKPVAGFQTASQLMMSSQTDDSENFVSDTQVSQSDLESHENDEPILEDRVESDDDCVIIRNDVIITPVKCEEPVEQPVAGTTLETVKTEIEATELPLGEVLSEQRTGDEDVSASSAKTPLKKPRKKRRMFITPLYDDYDG